MSGKTENGKRLSVNAPNFDGTAGLVGNELAFFPKNTQRLKEGMHIKVGNKNRKIVAVRNSDFVPKMIVVTLEAE